MGKRKEKMEEYRELNGEKEGNSKEKKRKT